MKNLMKVLFWGTLFASVTNLVACNTSRNIDQSERDRRMYSPPQDPPAGKTEVPGAEASPVQDFYFGNVSKEGALIKIDVSALFYAAGTENPFYYSAGQLYIDVHSKEVFILSSLSTLKKIGEIACKNETLSCTEFTFTSKVETVFTDKPLPTSIADLPLTITYQNLDMDMELWDLLASPAKLLSKFEGVRLTSSFFPKQNAQKLYSLSPAYTESMSYSLNYSGPDNEFYVVDYHLLPPTTDLIFNNCTTTESDDFLSLVIHCFFINPTTREVHTTKQALIHAKKN